MSIFQGTKKALSVVLGVTLVVMAGFTAKSFADGSPVKEFQVVDPAKTHLKLLAQEQPELVFDHVTKLGYEVYGRDGTEALLAKYGIKFVIPGSQGTKAKDYPTAEASIAQMQALQKKYPKLVSLIEIGKSVEGRSLMFARVAAPIQGTDTRPEFKYIANMHGDEIVGREMMVMLIQDLASHYGNDTQITQMLDHYQIYIMPSMNPDGATHQDRMNKNGDDLNRGFPDFTTTDNVNTPTNRPPEIQAIMAFEGQHHFKLSANFHGGAEVVNYPWDAQHDPFPLNDLIVGFSLDYTKQVPYIYNSTEFKNGITDGYDWYQVNGGMQDWSYHYYNDLQVTIELTTVKWPAFSTVAGSYTANRPALLGYIDEMAKF